MTNPHLWALVPREIYCGFGMKSALTERATEPWPKGVHPKEAEVEKTGFPTARNVLFLPEVPLVFVSLVAKRIGEKPTHSINIVLQISVHSASAAY